MRNTLKGRKAVPIGINTVDYRYTKNGQIVPFSLGECCHYGTRIPKQWFIVNGCDRFQLVMENKTMDKTQVPTLDQISEWVKLADTMVKDYNIKHHPDTPHYPLITTQGSRYARIVQDNSAWAFIDKHNGDVLKPETWNKPAKVARGNIFTHTPQECCSVHGPHYLR